MMWERDKSEVFKEEAEPILESLNAVLKRHQIPYFFCACVSNVKDENGKYVQKYVRDGRTVASYGKELPHGLSEDGLYSDEISRHYAITCGARIINDVEQEVSISSSVHEDFAVPLDEF